LLSGHCSNLPSLLEGQTKKRSCNKKVRKKSLTKAIHFLPGLSRIANFVFRMENELKLSVKLIVTMESNLRFVHVQSNPEECQCQCLWKIKGKFFLQWPLIASRIWIVKMTKGRGHYNSIFIFFSKAHLKNNCTLKNPITFSI
jgi:hypothetical protein